MKASIKKSLFTFFAAASTAAALVLLAVLPSCNKNPEPDVPNLDDPHMILTSEVPAFVQIYMSGTGTATIYWGDGKVETFNLQEESLEKTYGIFHSYYSGSGVTLITGKNITGLRCNNSKLTSLDASKNAALLTLDCSCNQLTNLDVSTIPYLKNLYCQSNRLISLNVSENIRLDDLWCQFNQLTSLDLSNNIWLRRLYCGYNQFTSAALNALFETLPIHNAKIIPEPTVATEALQRERAGR